MAGIALALALLIVYAIALWQVWRSPFRALGVLVPGMAFHNLLILALLALGTPHSVVRVVQAWKEGVLLFLLGLAVIALVRAWRAGRLPQLNALDLVVAAFTALAVLYTLLPPSLLHGSANLTQRALGARVLLLLPALYLFGRVFQPRNGDLAWVAWIITGAAGAVGLFGLVELWLLPTTTWLDWGVNQLSSWLGFVYNGPRGLPANFFQTTAEGGFLLRRMVSTYVSPLGIAYAGLVVLPMAVALILALKRGRSRWLAVALTVLLITGILFSLTRLALVMAVAELLIIAVLTGRRWVLYSCVAVALASVFMIFEYVYVGPLLDRNLHPVAQRPAQLHIAGSGDPSLREHTGLLGYDLQYVIHHPLGTGPGSSIHRFGPSQGTGESAVLDVFGDLGILGGLLYLLMYALSFVLAAIAYFRFRSDRWRAMLPLVFVTAAAGLAPITITTDLWSDFATTFLFWWAAGASVTLFSRRSSAARTAPASSDSRP